MKATFEVGSFRIGLYPPSLIKGFVASLTGVLFLSMIASFRS